MKRNDRVRVPSELEIPVAVSTALQWPLDIHPGRAGRSPAAAAGRPVALPPYLVKHYWWVYLWRPAVWFFDHQPIINAIVFGQYAKLRTATLDLLHAGDAGSTLLVASAYGNFIPHLTTALDGQPLTVIDATAIQLERAARKVAALKKRAPVSFRCMNAERLNFAPGSFRSVLLFMLLHELPAEVRPRVLGEALRLIEPGGRLVLAEYGPRGTTHPFHRSALLRWIFGKAEPFLPSLWESDLDRLVGAAAEAAGKRVRRQARRTIFGGFYQAIRYRVEAAY